ncbi:MAG: hypothetical protein RIR09_1422, partial [Pseudomonadota bacterium]
GFVDEVRRLRARGDLHLDLPSMRCVGYRQAWEVLDAHDANNAQDPGAPLSNTAIGTLRERGIIATRQLAKRQVTWLRAMPDRVVVACDEPGALESVLKAVSSALLRA